MAKKTKKKTAARKTTRKKATRAAAKAPVRKARIASTDTPRTKGQVFREIAENTELPRKKVQEVFDVLGQMIEKDLGRSGPGVFNVAGLMKVQLQRKPATKARKGTNPFTGEEMMFKAKPARNVVKVRPLKGLKDMV